MTITAGRALGLTRDAAARFSFLLLAPVVTGASIVEGADLARQGLPPGSAGPIIVGVVAAAVSGFAAIWVSYAMCATTATASSFGTGWLRRLWSSA